MTNTKIKSPKWEWYGKWVIYYFFQSNINRTILEVLQCSNWGLYAMIITQKSIRNSRTALLLIFYELHLIAHLWASTTLPILLCRKTSNLAFYFVVSNKTFWKSSIRVRELLSQTLLWRTECLLVHLLLAIVRQVVHLKNILIAIAMNQLLRWHTMNI
jgi:hypothetical protein